MIPERHMKQAKRRDNGELVVGYYRAYSVYHSCGKCIERTNHFIDTKDGISEFIDPDTVEDVAVKPMAKALYELTIHLCSNCDEVVASLAHYTTENYCSNCGQRIDWS